MSEREIIYYRLIEQTQIIDVLKELSEAKIEYRNCMMKNQINTKNVIIKLLVIPVGCDQRNYIKGSRAVGCFGFDKKTTDYLTRGNNVCDGYTFIKYIKDMDEMGY